MLNAFLAASLFLTLGCSQGSQTVDEFLGPDGENGDSTPDSAIDFDPTTWDFGSQLITVGTPLSKTVTVTNKSAGVVYIGALTGSGAPYFTVAAETCTTATAGLAQNQTCTFVVEFLPTAAGLHNFTITVGFGSTSGSSAKSASMGMIGTGIAPANLILSDGPSFNFGPVVVSATSEKTFNVSNVGGYPATTVAGGGLSAPFTFKGGSYPGTGGTCGTTLGAGATCSVVVMFSPTATGVQNDAIELDYFNGDANVQSTRAITGTGSTPAALAISDGPTFNYGDIAVGGVSEKVFTINNTGGVSAATVSGSGLALPFAFKGGNFPGTGGTCSGLIASGASCTIVVTYSPTAAAPSSDAIDIQYFDGLATQTESRAVQGTGVPPAALSISNGPTYNFGTVVVGSVNDVTLTISNSGGVAATALTGSGLNAPFSFKGGTYPGAGGTCGVSLAAAGSCTVVVTYAPTAVASNTGTVTIGFNNGVNAQTATRAVQGQAVSLANLTISDGPTYNYGTRPVGSNNDRTFTINNTGGWPATAVVGGGLAAPYTFKGGSYPGTGGTCAGTINAGTNCTIVVTYAPTASGTTGDSIELTYDNGLAAVVSSRAVAGTAVGPAVLSISDGPTFDFGTQPIGKLLEKSFTVQNTGGFNATAVSGAGLAAPYTFKGGSYPGTGGTCAATLAPGASCTVIVTYTVPAAVTSADTLEIQYNDGNVVQTATRDITGTGVTPANLSISDAPAYDFGPIATGAVAEATITVTNTGSFAASAMAGSGLTAPYTFKGGTYPGTGGTCGTTLAGGATCTVVIRFAPTTVGSVSRTLSMAYNDGVVAQTSTRTIQGLGAPPALLVISDGPTFNYGSIPFGSTATKTFTITNSGGVTANTLAGSGLSAPFTFLGGSYPGTGGSCGATLAATATCTIVVEYAPTAAGTTTRTISITYNNTVSNQTATRAISGSAVNPANITISGGTTYNFGTIAVGGVLEATLTLNNSGQFVASGMVSGGTIAAPFTFKGGSYPGTGGTCTATLNAGASCTIVLAFNPTIAGAQPGTVDVSFNNGVSIQTTSRALTGTGAAPALLTISNSPSYDFGSVATGGFAEFTFTITNGGGFPASAIAGGGLAAPFAFKGGTYPGTGGTCGITLNAAATCTIVVRFSPTVVTTSTDAIELNYFDGAVAQLVTRTVDGTGVSPALLSWSDGPTFDFGPVPTTGTAEKIFTITNTGTATATAMSGVALPLPFRWKGGTYPGTAGTCASSLAPAATCTVVVTFNPTALGTFTTNASISYNNGANTVTGVRAIQGVGANPGALVISDGPTFNFGSWPNGDTREKTFTVSNTGGVPATGISGGGLAAPYSYKGGTYPGTGGTCTTSLAATATCTIVVQYSPVALGTTSSTINLAYNTGIAAANSTRGVQGTAVAPANLVISDGATYNYGTVAVGASTDKVFTVTNSGAFPASVMSGGGVAVPFTFKGGSYPGTGGTCAATLNAGASCTLVVTYSPSTTGLQSGTVEVNYSNGVTPQISARAVQGTGAVPALLTVNEGPTFDYGTLPSGGTADKTFIITNSGGVPATAISGSGLAAPFAFKGGNFPGTGGTCTTSLAASATCTFVVTYAPTAPGSHADVVDINYTDGVGPQQTNRAIQGTAVPQATLAISDGPTYDYGTSANGSSTDYTFTVTNSGGVSATAVAGTSPTTGMFRFKGGTYPGTDGTCTTSLASGANCVIVVTYSPTASGNHTGTITLSFNTGVVTTTSSRALTGRGQPPANITISDGPTFSYGLRASGSSTDKTFTITNTGGVPATSLNGAGLAAPFEFKDGPYPGTGGTCGATLNAAATCTIIVTYEPAATGAYSDSIELTYDNGVLGGQLSQRAVTGTAAAPASLSISDGPTYDYGTLAVGGVAHKSFTINNSGGVQATSVAGGGLAAPYSFRGGTYPGTGGTCGTTLNAGASCVVWVSYSPTANDGPHLDSLEINFNNGLGATVASRDLTGNADAPAVISISDGPTFNFGTHPTTSSVDKVFTLTNTGEFTATAMTGSGLTAPIRFKGGTYPGTGGTCGASLNGAASCTVVVTFNPTANGSYNQTMTIGFNNGLSAQNSTRQILATGAPPATLAISDGPTFNFGTIANGGVAEKILTVTNSGGVAATAIAGTGLSAPYSYKGGGFPGTGGTCGATLNAATACTMVVEFSPTALGMFSSSATINFNNGLTGQSVSRAITGTAANPANLTLSDGPAYDYGTRATGATVDRTFTLTNSGNVSASSLAGAGLAAPFTFKGGTFPGTGGTCGTSLAASASCTVVVNWSPTATGPQSDTVEVNYWNGATNQTTTRLVQGVGATPALLSISDSPSFDYGTLASGSSVDKSFTITNSGGVSATGISGGGLATPFVFKGGTFPGTGGTCGATLADSATCTIVVTYNPTTVGARTDDIELTYNNGANSQSATRTVNGTSVPPANITISDGATFNFGTVANTASADKTFTLTNAGSFTATGLVGTGLSGMFSYKGGSYPGTGGTCGGTLNVAATCTVVVTFAPTASGLHSSTVNIGYFNGATTVASTRPVQGTGAPPANLTISDGPSFDFGTRATGSSTDKSFTISNTGGVPATSVAGAGLAAPFTFKGGTYPGTGGTCANTIAASATCTIVVTYAPTATGAQSDSIDFTYDSGVTGQSVARIVQGIGAAPASLSISDSPLYDYGSIANGAVLDRSFTITNSGGVPATALSGGGLAAPFSFKGGTFPGTGGTCTSTLAASGTCTVVVSFAPTAAGLHTDTLDLTYNDGVTGQSVSRDVQGTGVMPALLMISDGPTFDYGPVVVTGTQDKTFTITNTGSLQATTITGGGLVAPFTFKGGSYPGTGGTCGATLAAAASCTVVVTFAPTVTGGRNDTIEINYFDGALSQQSTRPIQGSGATPASITISDGPTFNFGILAQGADTNKTFNLTNSGGVPATAVAGSGLAAPFSFKDGTYPGTGGTCGATLAAAATCTIVVNYNPTTIATHNDTIEIAYNDGLAAQNAARNVTGTGVAPGFLSISDGATYDYGIVATGGSAEKIFTVTNTGSFAASAVSGTGLAAPFTFKGGTYPGTGGNCGATLNAGASCTVVVVYAPSATGTQSDAIEMNYFDGAGSQTANRAIQGTGAAPALLTISDGITFDFGSVANGSTNEKSFTISNSGGVPATGISGGGLAAPFNFKGGTFPGTGGTCGATLASAANCTIVVQYLPTTNTTHNDTIEISYTNGVTSGNLSTRPVTGTALPPANITISDGPTFNFGSVANGISIDKTFTLTNSGSFTATTMTGGGLAAPYTYKGGTYPGAGGTCSTTLAGAATCTVVVNFSPTTSATHNDTIEIAYSNGATNQTSLRNVTGISAPPASLTISDGPTFAFGTRATGSSTDKSFTVTNSGGVAATSVSGGGLAAPFTFKGGTFPGTGGTCAASITAGDSCTVVVTYAPTATGAQSDTMDISFNDGVTGQTSSRAMNGAGAAPASLAISNSPTYDFGLVASGGFAEATLTVANSGGVPATALSGGGLAAPFSFKGGTYPGAGGTCGTTLADSANCTMVVMFSPTVAGVQTDTLDLTYNNGVAGGQLASRDVQGNGVTPATLTISDGATFDYGPVVTTGSLDKTFTISNTGSLAATTMTGTGLAAPFTFKGGAYPGSGGTCGATLNSSANCTIVVTFTPPAVGPYNDSVEIPYYNGATYQTATRDVQGTGAAPANITISDGPTFSFGTLAQGGTADKTFTLTNGGGVPAASVTGAGLAAPYTYKGGTYPGTGGTCSGTLNAAAACTIVVNFNPSTIATHNDAIEINYNDGLTAQTSSRNVTGIAVAPANLVISDGTTYDFLTVATGGSAEKIFTVNNAGDFAASGLNGSGLAAPFTFKGGSYPGTGGNCSTTLNAGANCTIVVVYAPTATGSQSDTIEIAYNNGASAQTSLRPIQGTGADPALLTISDGATFNYGNLANGASADKSFTISNVGGVPATGISGGGLAAPFSFKGGGYPGTGGTCGTTLAASGNCTIVVTFNPTATATHNDSIDISYTNGLNSQSVSRAVTGTSTPPATITISDGPTYSFGTKANGSVSEVTLTLTNSGSFTATTMSGTGLAAPYAFKGGSYPGSGGTCTTTLSAAGTCTVVVTFSPTASGTYNDTVEIPYNNGVISTSSARDVTGVGAPPAVLAITDSPTYNYGTRATGSSTDRTFTVSNSGGIDATSISAGGLAAPFTFKGGTYPGSGGTCGTTIASAGSCTIVVTYAPVATGTQNDSVDFTYNDGVTASQSVSVGVQGTGAAPAAITISDGTIFNFGSIASGGTADKTFTLTNTGGVSATALSGGGLAAPFTFKGGTFPGTGGTCTTSLAASLTCTVVVNYSPTNVAVHNDTMDITFNNGVAAGQTSSRDITGTAVAPALLTISDSPSFDYGPVVATGSSDKTFTINNTGSVAATTVTGTGLAAPFTFKGGSYPGSGGTCGGTINASASCTIVITFNPSVTGPASDSIEMNYNDGAVAQTATRAVQGTGATPANITISDGATFSFGTVAQGSSNSKTFTVSNTGGVPATVIAGTGLSAPFSFKGGTFPGTGGTCTATLAAAANCTVVVDYNPSTIMTHNATMDITFNNGLVGGNTSSRAMTGTAVAPALIDISDGATFNFGTVATGGSAEKVFTLTNNGSFAASAMTNGGSLAAPFSYKGGSYPGTGGNCAAVLNPAATCTVVVVYAPTATGVQNGTLDISYNNGASGQTSTRAVTGTGASPASITISNGPTYNFGSVATGGSADHTFTLNNTGGVPATSIAGGGLAAPYTFKGGSFPGTGGTCTGPIAAGGSCTVVVTFAPTVGGAQNDTMDITFNNGVSAGNTVSRDITGTGVAPASLAISDGATFNYGPVVSGGALDKTFTITNSGILPATSVSEVGLAAPFAFKGGSFPGSGGTCTTSIAGGASCTIVVTFSPTATGSFSDTIDFTYGTGAGSTNVTRDVEGVGATPATVTISDGATFNFGTLAQGGTADKTFTLNNTGGVSATVLAGTGLAAPFSFKGGTFPGTGGTCTATLAAADSCTVVVTYSPVTAAIHNDTMDINYNDGVTGQTSQRAMTGTAVPPAVLAISDSPGYDFGTVVTGTTNERTFTVTNSGSFSASAMGGSGLAAPFAFKGGSYPGTGGTCTTALAASASCTVVVVYIPTGTGLQSATMAIAYNDGANVQSATRNIQGTGAAPALLSLSDGPTFSFGTRANGSSTDKTFVLSNTGGVTATSIAGSGLLAPYSFKGGTFPGTGGSCTTTLAAAANCTIVVTFAPSATATHNATMQVSYNDGSAGANTTRDITGVSAAPAALTISDGAIFNFGTIVTGTSSDKSFTINNTGGVVASGMSGSGLAAPFTFKGGTYPGAGGNCGATLSAGASCTVIVTFNPTVSTTSNDTMDVIFNDGVTGQISSRDLQGTGGPPANITISDGATFNYGTVANTSNNDKTFTLSNTGGAAATSMAGTGLAAPFGFKGGTYPGTGGTCGATLNGSDTCTIVVTYSPTSVGAQNDTIEINYYDGAASQQATRALAGTAVAPALLEISDGLTYDYGTQPLTKATDKTFTVTNNGSFSSSSMSGGGLAAPFAFKGGSYPGTGGTCGAALSPAASCTIVVTYTPTASGVHSGTINVNYNNGATAQSATRGVQGLGATAAILAISDGPTFSYGIRAISLSGEKTFTVSNSGGVSATGVAGGGLASPFFYKGGTYPGTGGTCTATLGGGSSCTIVVLFTPAAPGPASDTIEVDYNDGLIAQQATRDISGTGANPAYLSISDAVTFSFGTRETSSSTDKSFTLSNTGGVTATSMVASGISSPFTFKGGTFPGTGGTCGSTLMASGTCTFIVTYAPLATGTLNQTITIDYNDAVVSQSTTRPITGTAVAPAAPTALSRLLPAASPNNLDTVRVRVGGVVEGNTVRVFSDSACTAELASGVVGVGQTTIDIDFNVTVDGAYTFYANRSNSATSACSTATASYTRDTVAPTISGIANQTPGRSPHWSQSPTFRVSGTYAIGDTVDLFSNGTCTSAVEATGTTANTNQIDLTTSISLQGTYQYWARGRDPAGNQSSCFGPIVYNQDTSDVTVEFSSWSQVVNENTIVNVGLSLNASKPYPVSVYFKAQGTALDGVHTSGLAEGIITIPANMTSYNFTFNAINNGLIEKDKYVDLVLWDSSYEYVHPAGVIYHRVLIKDNDSSVVAPLALPFGNGNAFSCFVDGLSKLWCVGANSFGNLGVGDLVDREGYVAVDSSTDYTQVSVGQWHACGLTSTGVVKCWGSDNSGQMGNGVGTLANLEPQDVGLGTGNKFVVSGANSVCVIRSDDRLSCWGENSNGQLGDSSTSTRNVPVAVDGSNTYSKVVMGVNQTCGLRTNQKMFCWGQNANGATGLGVTSGNTTTPTAVDATVNFIDVAAGDEHFCAITTANKMKCWGWGGFGQLGSGSTADRTTPLAVDTAQNYTSVAAGRAHTCGVVQTSGAMRCTGNNNMAQHFDRQQLQTTIFYGVAPGLSFARASAFEDSSWGLLTNGEVYYAGGDLPFAFSGDNRATLVKVAPTQIDDGRTFSSLDRGWGERSFCAISNSKIRCSGFSNGSDAIFGIGPTALLVGSSWTDAKNDYTMVGSGWQHICGLQQVGANQKLFCSGNASFNGSGVASNLMVAVDSANNYVSLSVGYNHSCAIRSSGALVCWGSNSNSKLGDGTTVMRLTPVVVDSGTAYVKISAGFEHTCGITSLGVLKCWGANANGRTGLNTTSGSRSTPGVVDSGVSYAEVSAGENHTCGVTTTGVLKCWGNNQFGMLGLGSTTQFLVPQTVGSSFSRVAAAQNSTCAITSSGGLRCAGQWNLGMAGQTNTNWLSLATVDGGTTYTEIRAGRLSMCALDSAGRVRCWGNNFYNTFGNTTNIWFPEAVPVPGFNQ